MKTFQEYSDAALKTDVGTKETNQLSYICLGISGESGEICDHVKKHIRDDNGKMGDKRRELILKEVGDVLWYLNKLTIKLGSSLSEAAEMNIKKLQSRQARGQIHGSGDDR